MIFWGLGIGDLSIQNLKLKKNWELIEENRQSIEKAVDTFINEDIKQAINQYFQQIDSYIESYRNGLKKSLENQKLSSSGKKELAVQLDQLSPDMAQLIDRVKKLGRTGEV
ncbi:hypothetical protein ACQFX9_16505 [Aliinostoc sp. HNIBRCY26]|uniref:hypothetical protein n=1 Tax=Aliinostoc sp. HNIBRCY26 TaxID=3418997 RepID=UPI003CFDC118